MLLVISGLEKNMKALILIAILIGAPFLIQSADALLIDIKPLCLSEAIRDNGTNITAVARTFDQCIQKMQMLDDTRPLTNTTLPILLPGSEPIPPNLCVNHTTTCGQ